MKIEFGKIEFGVFKVEVDVSIHSDIEDELVTKINDLEQRVGKSTAGLKDSVDKASQ